MKVTEIYYSLQLTNTKLLKLSSIAKRLGTLRSEIWNEFGSLKGLKLTHRTIRDQWLKENKIFNVPARLWKETLRDVIGDITAYREAAKFYTRQAIYKHYKTDKDQEIAYKLLRQDQWLTDSFLRRQMRKNFKHGHSRVSNQIILDSNCYTAFTKSGKAWIHVMSLERGKRIAIPLTTNKLPTGTLRLIIREDRVEVHTAVEVTSLNRSMKSCGSKTIGVDKGYSEVFTDSEGYKHGKGLGLLLSSSSDYLKAKYQKRNKLKAIKDEALKKGDYRQARRIENENLGRQKLEKRKQRHTQRVKDLVYKAAHSVVDKAQVIAAEDLTSSIPSKSLGKNTNRRLAAWVKGLIAAALDSVSRRRCASVVLVNCAYTSQMDSISGLFRGDRRGDSFYCTNGDVLDADWNAARNILARLDDPDINRYTPYYVVKSILLKRTRQRLGLLNQDSRCYEEGFKTDCTSNQSESELPNFD